MRVSGKDGTARRGMSGYQKPARKRFNGSNYWHRKKGEEDYLGNGYRPSIMVYWSPDVNVMTTITRSVFVVPIRVTDSPISGLFRAPFSVTQSERTIVTFIRVTIPFPSPPLKVTVIVGFSVIELRSTVTLTDSYDGTIWVGPGTSEHACVGVTGGVCIDVRTAVGAGTAGDCFWVHPPIKVLRTSIREMRSMKVSFMAWNQYESTLMFPLFSSGKRDLKPCPDYFG
jgi:hypothetical protein